METFTEVGACYCEIDEQCGFDWSCSATDYNPDVIGTQGICVKNN